MRITKIVFWLLVVCLLSYSNDSLGSCGTIGFEMMKATKSGKYDMLKKVLEKAKKEGCKLPNNYGGYDSYIMVAARNQHYEIIKLLLEYGLDIDEQEKPTGSSRIYKTALMEAVEKKNTTLIKFLQENGADPQYKSTDGVSAMDIAIESSNIDIVKLFIKYFNEKEDLLFKILRKKQQENRVELVEMLLKYGADANLKDTITINQPTFLMAAVSNAFIEKDKQLGIVKLLLENGANVNVRNNSGQTAFFFVTCLSTSSYDLAKLLIDSDAEVFYFATRLRTPFISAIASGNFAIAILIIWKVFFSITLLLFIYSFSVTRKESGRERYQSSIKLFTLLFSVFIGFVLIILAISIFESGCFNLF